MSTVLFVDTWVPVTLSREFTCQNNMTLLYTYFILLFIWCLIRSRALDRWIGPAVFTLCFKHPREWGEVAPLSTPTAPKSAPFMSLDSTGSAVDCALIKWIQNRSEFVWQENELTTPDRDKETINGIGKQFWQTGIRHENNKTMSGNSSVIQCARFLNKKLLHSVFLCPTTQIFK